ncbi:siroheme synthase CysG [Biformimicrobium ophioploci]|uniref:Siroheme synthase n=1 Tax=Biformimicrobium ophioploci TaxID=3036711 RepID=A0ABQ6M1N0_9GAMM|nr:siroheme synthase CysG [Microbulbifer sp. NKW57]GMG88223.1 siroheme synthase CysG [Microbulbifer sp. NKW57]
MRYLPIAFDVAGRKCLIVGGGSTALRKARLLQKASAAIHVVAPEVKTELADIAASSGGGVAVRTYRSADLADSTLVIAATADTALNEQVAVEAKRAGTPVNVVDQPALCTFTFPSMVERGPLAVGISSGGSAPVLARKIRAELETQLSPSLGELAELCDRYRPEVKARLPENARRAFWEAVIHGEVAALVERGDSVAASAQLERMLEQAASGAPNPGEVYLVGAGPGDPDLLTFRALRLMQQADVVLYDRLVSDQVMELVRRDADRIYVGKKKAFHAVPQDDINQLLVDLAKEGKRVLRLKGGDPFIFGRGGEEIDKLAQAGIPFQVVPGITAAAGCASYAGIPLTHRDHAQSVRFITGHLKEGELALPWVELASPGQTLVFYMGLTGLEIICGQLIEHGMPAHTPIAVIEKGTTRQQRVVIGTLADMPRRVVEEEVSAPALTIIGGVVRLHDTLNWYSPALD